MKRSGPLKRTTELRGGAPLRRTGFRRVEQSAPNLPRRTALSHVSDKRAVENRLRRALIARLWPERPRCAVPDCPRLADDVHEPLTRARGGSITDEDNLVPLCRPHHDEITFKPESALGWAYELGLLKHSWETN